MGELGCEGTVSKRIDAPYTAGRSETWLKCKHVATGVFRVIGYVPDGERIEAVLIAERKGRNLRPVGRVPRAVAERSERASADRDLTPALAWVDQHFSFCRVSDDPMLSKAEIDG